MTDEDPDPLTGMGRGSRTRKEVDYTDSLTEKEWLKVRTWYFFASLFNDEIFYPHILLQAIDDTIDDFSGDDEEVSKPAKKTRKKTKRRGSMSEDDDDDEGGSYSKKKKKKTTKKTKSNRRS